MIFLFYKSNAIFVPNVLKQKNSIKNW